MSGSIEILSPAGSFEAFVSAVDSGADAVYFGGRAFSARKNAVNLSDEEITQAINYAHLRGAKAYVAVNTLMFDSELEASFGFMKFCYEQGVDAFIVQDLGIAKIAAKHFPDVALHASTQMTIHNLAGALEAQKLGFKRVVLSRELSLSDISHISKNCSIELEVFVHGALCMSYSGQCLTSSFLGGRSGNRGACAQPCRLPYTLYDSNGNKVSEDEKYLLSLKDLCLIDNIAELKRIGVTSLKIEGRMKSSAYVSAVTGIYHKYRDGKKVSEEDRLLLQNIFSRGGFTDGHFKDKHGREMLSYNKNHDDIFQSATKSVIDDAKSLANVERKTKIDAVFTMKEGSKIRFEASYLGNVYSCEGETEVSRAVNAPVTAKRAEEQLRKLGSTVLEFSSIKLVVDEGLYVPIKEINSVRREVCEQIEKEISGTGRKYTGEEFALPGIKKDFKSEVSHRASVLNDAQADVCYELGFSKIYVPYSLYIKNKEKYDSDPDVFTVKLPPVNHDSKKLDYSKIGTDAVCITNIGQIYDLRGKYKLHADYRLNVYNSFSLRQLSAMGVGSVCVSTEMTLSQISKLSNAGELEILVYGKIPLMTVKNCVVKSAFGKCACRGEELFYLRDRKAIDFPLETQKGECVNIIYNSAPIYMADRMSEIKKLPCSYYRFDFVDEKPEEILMILKQYEHGRKSNGFFTRGHYYNGVVHT